MAPTDLLSATSGVLMQLSAQMLFSAGHRICVLSYLARSKGTSSHYVLVRGIPEVSLALVALYTSFEPP